MPGRPPSVVGPSVACRVRAKPPAIARSTRAQPPAIHRTPAIARGISMLYDEIAGGMGSLEYVGVLIRLIGADETIYSSYVDSMQWLDDIQVLEIIADKFFLSVRTKDYFSHLLKDSPEVHANATEILCAITRYAPPVVL
ncbi:hypothetical protein ABZP36_025784 [Zizania latifolia]